jgi:hypothetical protein
MLFICTYSLLVSIFENVGLASFPSVIAFLASSKERAGDRVQAFGGLANTSAKLY